MAATRAATARSAIPISNCIRKIGRAPARTFPPGVRGDGVTLVTAIRSGEWQPSSMQATKSASNPIEFVLFGVALALMVLAVLA